MYYKNHFFFSFFKNVYFYSKNFTCLIKNMQIKQRVSNIFYVCTKYQTIFEWIRLRHNSYFKFQIFLNIQTIAYPSGVLRRPNLYQKKKLNLPAASKKFKYTLNKMFPIVNIQLRKKWKKISQVYINGQIYNNEIFSH